MTYIVVGISCQSSDVHELSTRISNGEVLGSVAQSGSEMMEGDEQCRSMAGTLDDGHPFEKGYFGFLDGRCSG